MNDTAQTAAMATVENIYDMVTALEVDYDRLAELRGMIDENGVMEGDTPEERLANCEELAELEEAAGNCNSEDEARDVILEDALSVEVRSGWADAGSALAPDEFRIVLCTVGPHVEIRGDINKYNEPASVRVLYSGFGEVGELFDFDHEAVLKYCRQFYFGE